MANILKDSSTRIKTAIVLLVAVVLLGLIDSFFLFWAAFGVMLMVAISESKVLYDLKSDTIYVYAAIIWLIAYYYPMPEDLIFIAAIGMAAQLAYKKKLNKKLFLPLLYPTASFLFLLSLYSEYGVMSLLWLLVIVAAADTGAYFVGKSFGKTQFSETSPNKTIEGVIGGLIIATILGVIFAIDNIPTWGAIIISLVVALASVFGDLFESYLKREAGVKDSGDILPGHGGILDRTDGYLFGGIIMLILLRVVI